MSSLIAWLWLADPEVCKSHAALDILLRTLKMRKPFRSGYSRWPICSVTALNHSSCCLDSNTSQARSISTARAARSDHIAKYNSWGDTHPALCAVLMTRSCLALYYVLVGALMLICVPCRSIVMPQLVRRPIEALVSRSWGVADWQLDAGTRM